MSRMQWLRAAAAVILAIVGLAWMSYFAPLRMPTVLVYSGIVILCAGAVTVLLPARWSGFARRIDGLLCGAALGVVLFAAGWLWPPHNTVTAGAPVSRLDAVMPTYDFHEHHEILIDAPADRVVAVLHQVCFADVGAVQALGRIRAIAMGQFRPPQGGGVAPVVPLVEMFNDPRSGFFPLDTTPRELVFGMAGQPWANRAYRLTPDEFRAWSRPDCVRIAFNFRVEEAGRRTRAITDTRVAANDDSARRKMAHYWTLIYPGTGMIRRSLLAAVRDRAEGR
jgi:hypothetical protein